jgi:hypothetical protein
MKLVLPLALAAATSIGSFAIAAPETPKFTQGTRVVVVGEITSPPKGELNEKKMQIGIGPQKRDYTLHFSDAQLFGLDGRKIDEDGFNNRQWVRAEGTVMDDPRRIKVDRVQVIAPDHGRYGTTAFFRPGWDYGYVTSVAGVRQTFPVVETRVFTAGPITVVGRVSDDTGPLESTRKLQLMTAGNEWTLHVPAEAMIADGKGEKISVHEIKEDQWIRATGWQTDDLRMRVLRIENLGSEDAFRTTKFFRTEYPLGYFERGIDGRMTFDTVSFHGTVVDKNRDFGYVTVREPNGDLHRVYLDMATVEMDGRIRGFDDIRSGDRIRVTGRILR